MRKSVTFCLICILGVSGLAYCEQPVDSATPKARVLVGSPIRQKPQILTEFLQSLERQARANYSIDYFFVDDNVDEVSRHILTQFQQKVGEGCHIELPNQNYEGLAYACNEICHYWSGSTIWKLAAFKDRMINRACVKEYDYLFLIDSDIVLHPDTIDTLIKARKDIISNVFWTRWTPEHGLQPQVWLFDTLDCYPLGQGEVLSRDQVFHRWLGVMAQMKIPGVYEVGGLGACTLISREALLKGVSFKRLTNLSFWGEDRHFCVRAVALGLRLFVDTHLPACHIYRESMLTGVPHYKWACEHHAPLPLVPTPRLTLSMVVRNEANGYLRRVLESAREYIDDAVIIDDASDDETAKICEEVLQGIPLRLIRNTEPKCANQVELRKQQWEETAKVNPDWIVNLDADEIFEKKFASQVKDLIRDNEVDVYTFPLYDMWDEWYYRNDRYWCGHRSYFPLLIRYKPGITYEWEEAQHHCGRFPLTVLNFPKQKQSSLRMKHYGWSTFERRMAKAELFARADHGATYGCKEQYESILDPSPNLAVWVE